MPLTLQILAAYEALTPRPGGTIYLADLREHLASVDRAELDATLIDLDRAREIQLEPDPDRAALTQKARAAAVELGGQSMHLMRAVA